MDKIGLDLRALDPTFKEHSTRGIGRYVRRLYSELQLLESPGIEVVPVAADDFPFARSADRVASFLPVGRQTVRNQLFYPLQLALMRSSGMKLLHFSAQMDAPAWSRLPYVITVHDLIPFIFEDLYRAGSGGWRFRLARALEVRGILGARRILTVSENTARDVERIFKIPREKISVTHNGVDNVFFSKEWKKLPADEASRIKEDFSLPLNHRLIVYVGGIDERKNIKRMFESVRILVTRHRERGVKPPFLLMVGKIAQARHYPQFKEDLKSLHLEDYVRELGYVADEHLVELLSVVDLFLYPTLYEGFGLPPLEAAATGVPVVASNTSSMPEVLGDGALLVNPESVEEIAEAAFSLLIDREASLALSERGRAQARKFPWSKTAEQTIEAYRIALS